MLATIPQPFCIIPNAISSMLYPTNDSLLPGSQVYFYPQYTIYIPHPRM